MSFKLTLESPRTVKLSDLMVSFGCSVGLSVPPAKAALFPAEIPKPPRPTINDPVILVLPTVPGIFCVIPNCVPPATKAGSVIFSSPDDTPVTRDL